MILDVVVCWSLLSNAASCISKRLMSCSKVLGVKLISLCVKPDLYDNRLPRLVTLPGPLPDFDLLLGDFIGDDSLLEWAAKDWGTKGMIGCDQIRLNAMTTLDVLDICTPCSQATLPHVCN